MIEVEQSPTTLCSICSGVIQNVTTNDIIFRPETIAMHYWGCMSLEVTHYHIEYWSICDVQNMSLGHPVTLVWVSFNHQAWRQVGMGDVLTIEVLHCLICYVISVVSCIWW